MAEPGFIPSTIAAVWTLSSNGGPLTIVFVCSCIGKPKVHQENLTVPRDYVKGLYCLAQNCMLGDRVITNASPNQPGNCLEQ